MQVPAHSITGGVGSGINEQLLAAINTSFNGSPEMTITDTGIDDTLLSYVRCAVAPEAQLLQAGWQTGWTDGGADRNLPLDTMARLVDPIDFNTEAKVRPLAVAAVQALQYAWQPACKCSAGGIDFGVAPSRQMLCKRSVLCKLYPSLELCNVTIKHGCR